MGHFGSQSCKRETIHMLISSGLTINCTVVENIFFAASLVLDDYDNRSNEDNYDKDE